MYGATELNSTLRLSVETELAASLSRAIERELQAAEGSSELLLHEAPGPATAAFLAQSRTVARGDAVMASLDGSSCVDDREVRRGIRTHMHGRARLLPRIC